MQEHPPLLRQRVQNFVEHFLAAMPGGQFARADIAEQWVNEVMVSAKRSETGPVYAPDQYTLSLHPKDYEALTQKDHLSQTKLSASLRLALEGAQMSLAREPHITLATDPTLALGQVRVIAWHSSDPILEAKRVAQEDEEVTETPPEGAFFMIEGSRHFPLDRTLVNIGRRLDNHLVLENPHISRRHAQLRVRGGRFTLYDLNSTSGTRVNGKRVQEWVLKPGDVITLATVQLIYGEDPSGPPPVTSPYTPPFTRDVDRDRVTPLDLTTIEQPIKKTDKLKDELDSDSE
jgi:hypothetical protein